MCDDYPIISHNHEYTLYDYQCGLHLAYLLQNAELDVVTKCINELVTNERMVSILSTSSKSDTMYQTIVYAQAHIREMTSGGAKLQYVVLNQEDYRVFKEECTERFSDQVFPQDRLSGSVKIRNTKIVPNYNKDIQLSYGVVSSEFALPISRTVVVLV
jgi:hypothetical protein